MVYYKGALKKFLSEKNASELHKKSNFKTVAFFVSKRNENRLTGNHKRYIMQLQVLFDMFHDIAGQS